MSASTSDRYPKRVILRMRYNDFEDRPESYNKAIEAYLSSTGREFIEYQERRHIAHIEGYQDYQEDNPTASFHIILDMEKAAIKKPDWNKLPHEVHRIRRRKDDGKLTVTPLPDRYVDLARSFTDKLYSWGELDRMKDSLETNSTNTAS